jgi:hypothetical protein
VVETEFMDKRTGSVKTEQLGKEVTGWTDGRTNEYKLKMAGRVIKNAWENEYMEWSEYQGEGLKIWQSWNTMLPHTSYIISLISFIFYMIHVFSLKMMLKESKHVVV